MDGRMHAWTDNAKTISLQLLRGIIIVGCSDIQYNQARIYIAKQNKQEQQTHKKQYMKLAVRMVKSVS